MILLRRWCPFAEAPRVCIQFLAWCFQSVLPSRCFWIFAGPWPELASHPKALARGLWRTLGLIPIKRRNRRERFLAAGCPPLCAVRRFVKLALQLGGVLWLFFPCPRRTASEHSHSARCADGSSLDLTCLGSHLLSGSVGSRVWARVEAPRGGGGGMWNGPSGGNASRDPEPRPYTLAVPITQCNRKSPFVTEMLDPLRVIRFLRVTTFVKSLHNVVEAGNAFLEAFFPHDHRELKPLADMPPCGWVLKQSRLRIHCVSLLLQRAEFAEELRRSTGRKVPPSDRLSIRFHLCSL